MHNWPRLLPHRLLNWLLRNIMLSLPTTTHLLRCSRAHHYIRRIRDFIVNRYSLLLMFQLRSYTGDTRESDRSEAINEISGFLLHGFAFVFLVGSGETVAAAEHSCRGVL